PCLPRTSPRPALRLRAAAPTPTRSLRDALPISHPPPLSRGGPNPGDPMTDQPVSPAPPTGRAAQWRAAADVVEAMNEGCGQRKRSEEHTSELQSREKLVCRLLLEKKKRADAGRR